ncbi:hypothetical protein LEN26_015677 [Aphanomyces euteiches]|nr:hypothetical protein LEN26_015677 [Aphanomyces euteiches]KAH9122125.1 hypothetical protein AeMF1_006460 [Aphanomyces euteiches]KAH9182851.1 hypothetical protein AeNC1_015173 [Aphanomyces euteiches]
MVSIHHLLPTYKENCVLREIFPSLKRFNSVNLSLQSNSITLADARMLLNKLSLVHPDLTHLHPQGDIVRNPTFELAVVKVQDHQEAFLTNSEKVAIEKFLIDVCRDDDEEEVKDEEGFFAQEALREKKEQRSEFISSRYTKLDFAFPTSNIAERLFSSAKHVLTDYRKHMHTHNFEMVIFLKSNRELWGIEDLKDKRPILVSEEDEMINDK